MAELSEAEIAWETHVDAHGCGCSGRALIQRHFCKFPEQHERNGGHLIPGTAHCGEAMRLWDQFPPDRKVAFCNELRG